MRPKKVVPSHKSGYNWQIDTQNQREALMKRSITVCLLLLTWAAAAPLAWADDFFFRDCDRIVFLGDSITEQYQYSNDIELYLTTRFPKWRLTFLNAGIGGDTATGGAGRFAGHVLAERPTAVTIDFGMNDGGYGAFKPDAAANFIKKTEEMLAAARKAQVRVALISPNSVDARLAHPFKLDFKLYRETQKQFYAPLKDLAARYEVPFVDQYAITRAGLEKMAQQHQDSLKPFPDGVHTSSLGGLYMAHTILTGLHAPALVSEAAIDISASGEARIAHETGCTINKLQTSSGGVSFERLDDALPLPVQTDWLPLLPYVNELRDLNWYGLKVTGLTPGRKYEIVLDHKPLGVTYSAEQLSAGVNMGNGTSGPIHAQANRVSSAIDAKNKIVHERFRSVVMFQAPDWLAAAAAELKPRELARLIKLIDEKQAEIYKMVQPAPHTFELVGR
jgi:lysophospholipase L1-like esterase